MGSSIQLDVTMSLGAATQRGAIPSMSVVAAVSMQGCRSGAEAYTQLAMGQAGRLAVRHGQVLGHAKCSPPTLLPSAASQPCKPMHQLSDGGAATSWRAKRLHAGGTNAWEAAVCQLRGARHVALPT